LNLASDATPESSSPDMTIGYQAIDAGEYDAAIAFFETILVDHPRTAEAFNQLGYINRRLQNFDQAFVLYSKALDLDPGHTGAHNYVGESYLEVGDLAMAEYHLGQLDLLCLFGCQDYSELEQAVALYKVNNPR
jgi:Flp pilus assembly protein TadD